MRSAARVMASRTNGYSRFRCRAIAAAAFVIILIRSQRSRRPSCSPDGFCPMLVVRKTLAPSSGSFPDELASNEMFKLFDGKFLITYDTFHQIANRDQSNLLSLLNDRKMADPLVGHNRHTFFH